LLDYLHAALLEHIFSGHNLSCHLHISLSFQDTVKGRVLLSFFQLLGLHGLSAGALPAAAACFNPVLRGDDHRGLLRRVQPESLLKFILHWLFLGWGISLLFAVEVKLFNDVIRLLLLLFKFAQCTEGEDLLLVLVLGC